jgi:hypothetical protein
MDEARRRCVSGAQSFSQHADQRYRRRSRALRLPHQFRGIEALCYGGIRYSRRGICRNQADVCFGARQGRFELKHSAQDGFIGKDLGQRFGGRQAID